MACRPSVSERGRGSRCFVRRGEWGVVPSGANRTSAVNRQVPLPTPHAFLFRGTLSESPSPRSYPPPPPVSHTQSSPPLPPCKVPLPGARRALPASPATWRRGVVRLLAPAHGDSGRGRNTRAHPTPPAPPSASRSRASPDRGTARETADSTPPPG